MPYWGANVKSDVGPYSTFVVQAKIWGEHIFPAPAELIEYISNLVKRTEIQKEDLAKFFSDRIASAFRNHPEAEWVTVDLLMGSGETYGHTTVIKE